MFAQNLKTTRKSKKISQEELAKQLIVSKQSIYKWEKGLCYPDINNLKNISDYFNVSIDTLVNNEIQTSKNKNIKKKSFFKILKYTTPYLLIFILIKLNK